MKKVDMFQEVIQSGWVDREQAIGEQAQEGTGMFQAGTQMVRKEPDRFWKDGHMTGSNEDGTKIATVLQKLWYC